jgi:hypothetical protein
MTQPVLEKSKKYAYQLVKARAGWTAEILRRVTSKKTLVTKSQTGFASEAEAQTWAEAEVKVFLKNVNLSKGKKRRAREQKRT